MRPRNAIMAMVASAIIVVSAAPAPAMASTVSPATGTGCYSGIFGFNDYAECTTVTGTGLKVTSIAGKAVNSSSQPLNNVHLEFYGPKGVITNTATFNLPGNTQTGWYTWHNPNPNAIMPAGDYCTELWIARAGGGYTSMADACIEVHT
jgi:hypothetical protein